MRRPCRQGQLHPFPPPKYETPSPNEALDPRWLLAHSAAVTLHRVRCLCQRIPFNSLQGVTKDLSPLMISSFIHPTYERGCACHWTVEVHLAPQSSEQSMKGFDENGEGLCRGADTR